MPQVLKHTPFSLQFGHLIVPISSGHTRPLATTSTQWYFRTVFSPSLLFLLEITSSTHEPFYFSFFKALQTNVTLLSVVFPNTPNGITSSYTGLYHFTDHAALQLFFYPSSQDSPVNMLKSYAKYINIPIYAFLSHSRKPLRP